MKLGLVGLGRMGLNMRERLRERGLEAIGYDPHTAARDVDSLESLVESLPAPRSVWVMVPAGAPTREVIGQLSRLLAPGDLVVDGGNSRFTDDTINADVLAGLGIRYVDCGVSGGIWGRQNGYALMAGGDAADIDRLMPVFDALRPDGDREDSFVHAGPVGAGHYAKMVHNGIEYGLMQAYAEGYELLAAEDSIADVPAVLRAWSKGTVVRSWLLDLLVQALSEDPGLSSLSGFTEDSGEGRWTVEEAIAHAVPAPVISAALFARFASRQHDSPAMKAVSALRNQFGGHAVRRAEPAGIA
ncbi:6-phosphogluconate dehydrogenase [Rhodococcus wratislaviensis]|uniref:6-phosphogluconate dehydrogenase n=2 Tax=Rhodococcus TaxID=1827 RepID=A0AB38F6P5_RHOWR|nr:MULTISPECIES: decarboxylating 6-phosphogluconate dehydrogenase [Rhodococcus]AII03443.1 6-phosphogluconate dehydrogenase [Rhodococcus opacus]REE70754.1 6-phosphogluconate dehydrogenase [Rhodococcus wratislaviensis]WAM18889.1 decarboxylating 6-phosphogluconate dehydrogenase [Rhodococcus sp. JS3073]SPZ34861.1 6-phosphogluconate dehydrogenase [Rhodococcus wratislaviensis]